MLICFLEVFNGIEKKGRKIRSGNKRVKKFARWLEDFSRAISEYLEFNSKKVKLSDLNFGGVVCPVPLSEKCSLLVNPEERISVNRNRSREDCCTVTVQLSDPEVLKMLPEKIESAICNKTL
jgi:hypothetical protein